MLIQSFFFFFFLIVGFRLVGS